MQRALELSESAKELLSCHAYYAFLRLCVIPRVTYLSRICYERESNARAFDDQIFAHFGEKLDLPTTVEHRILGLPIRLGGLGLQRTYETIPAARGGAGISYLTSGSPAVRDVLWEILDAYDPSSFPCFMDSFTAHAPGLGVVVDKESRTITRYGEAISGSKHQHTCWAAMTRSRRGSAPAR